MKRILCLALLISIAFASKAQFNILHNFNGTPSIFYQFNEGALASDGTFLYGATQFNGLYNLGYIYKVRPDGSMYDTVHNFIGSPDGARPCGTLVYDGTYLYGIANGGPFYNGVIYRVKPDGSNYSIIYSFTGGVSDGGILQGSLYYDGTYLYGTAGTGGSYMIGGTAFRIMPDGSSFQKIHDFAGFPDGSNPYCGLVSDGTYLYGTAGGGANNNGMIFKMLPDGSGYADVFDFSYTSSGSAPFGSLIFDGTYLYGMTTYGGADSIGTVYRVKPDGTGFLKLLDFNGPNGDFPSGNLLSDGTFLYGMTSEGGNNGDGLVFKIRTDGSDYSILEHFNITDGQYPDGTLYSDGSSLYGRTRFGGGTDSCGTLFKLSKECLAGYTTSYDSALNNFTVLVDAATASAAVSYHWDFGDGATSTLATPSHVYTVDSLYNVCMKVYFAAGDSCTYCRVIGIDTAGGVVRTGGFTLNVINAGIVTGVPISYRKGNALSVYPNPASSRITVELELEQPEVITVEIRNSLGQTMQVEKINGLQAGQNDIEMNIGMLAKGLYFIKIKHGAFTVNTKIIKE